MLSFNQKLALETILMIKMILFSLPFFLLSVYAEQDNSYDLIVKVHNIKKIKGSLKYAVYNDDENFLKEAFAFGGTDIIDNTIFFKVDGLKKGTYAVSIFHDENDNGELDANFMGIPSEPYAFSNNAKGMFGPPSFKDCRFELKESTQISIEL